MLPKLISDVLGLQQRDKQKKAKGIDQIVSEYTAGKLADPESIKAAIESAGITAVELHERSESLKERRRLQEIVGTKPEAMKEVADLESERATIDRQLEDARRQHSVDFQNNDAKLTAARARVAAAEQAEEKLRQTATSPEALANAEAVSDTITQLNRQRQELLTKLGRGSQKMHYMDNGFRRLTLPAQRTELQREIAAGESKNATDQARQRVPGAKVDLKGRDAEIAEAQKELKQIEKQISAEQARHKKAVAEVIAS